MKKSLLNKISAFLVLMPVLFFVIAGKIIAQQEKTIPFRKDQYPTDNVIFKLFFLLILVAIITYGVVYLIKRYYQGGFLNKSQESSINLLEYKRLPGNLTIYKLELDKKEVYLMQNASNLVILNKSNIMAGNESVDKIETS